jgi:hypothetical protein
LRGGIRCSNPAPLQEWLGCGNWRGSHGWRIATPEQYVAAFRNVDHDCFDIGIAKVIESARIVENEFRLPEWVLEPAAFQLVHKHAHFDL